MQCVLVTGATGNAGKLVLRSLLDAGPSRCSSVRAGVRSAKKALRSLPQGVDAVKLDMTDASTYREAATGVDGMFLMRPPSVSNVGATVNKFVDAAAAQGVHHIVFMSVANAPVAAPHYKVEQHLKTAYPAGSSTMTWTILRPGFFAQNLCDQYRQDLLEDNRLYVPAAGGLVSWLDLADLADITAAVFADHRSHAGKTYNVSGGDPMTFGEVASLLTSELGRPIEYKASSVLGYVMHLLYKRKKPLFFALIAAFLHYRIRKGDAEDVASTTRNILGRAPRSLLDFVHENREAWIDPAP